MGFTKRQLQEKADAEYFKESICSKCGDEREEITIDHDTFWVCYTCDCASDYEYIDDAPPPENYDEL